MSGRAATRRSQASSTSVTCVAVDATAATPISARRCSGMLPVSATATPGWRRCTAAMIDRTTERFCFSDRTSPSSTSRVRAPTYKLSPGSSVPRLLPHLVGLDHVIDLDVVIADADTALVALADLGHVLLEPAQRLDREALLHHDTVADQASLAAPVDRAGTHQRAGDVADPGHPEDLPDLGGTKLHLLELGLEHALECGLDLLDRLVDDRVVADVDALALGQLARAAGRPHVEAHDHGLRGDGQVDVVLGDRADPAADDPQHHVIAHVDLEQRVLQGLDRPGHVTLDDQQQFLPLTRLERGLEVLQGDPGPALGELGAALPRLAALGDLPGDPVVGHDEEAVASPGHGGEAEHLDRPRRRRLRHGLEVVVEQSPHPAKRLAADDRVTDPERAPLHEDGGHRAAPAVEVCLDRHALGVLVGVGPQVELGVGGQDDRLEQVLDTDALPGGDVHEQGGAAELLGHQAVLGELGPHPRRVRALLVDLVDGDDHRHVGGLGVVERLGRLRLHAVVRGHDEHDQVGGLGAAGPHGGECLVARGVDERDLAVLAVHLGGNLVGADVLGDAARLAGHHVGVPDGVEQFGLAVVNVTHDGNHRRARLQVGFLALVLTELDVERLEQLLVLFLRRHDLDVVVQLGTEQLQRLVVHRLGGGDHLAEVEQHLNQRRRVHPDLVGEVTQRRTPGQPDDLAVAARDLHAADRRRLHVVELLAPLLARLAALGRTPARAPEGALGATAAAATGTATRPAAAATAHAGTRRAAATGPGTRAGTTTAAGAGASRATGAAGTTTARATGATTTWAAWATTACRARRHVARAGPRPAGPRAAWPLYIRRSRPPGSATGPRACLPGRCPRHRAGLAAPRRGRTRCYAHAGSGLAIGIVARARPGTGRATRARPGGGRATRSALPAGPWLPWARLRCSPLRRGRPGPCGRRREGDLRCRCRRAGRRGLRCRCRGFGRPGRSLLARCRARRGCRRSGRCR